MRLTVYQNVDVFADLEPEWNDLLRRNVNNHIFSTWEWQSTWWDAYHPGELWVVAFRNDEGRLVGLAPWFVKSTQDAGKVVHTIGCVEVSDYLDLLVDPDYAKSVYETLADFLHTHCDQCDKLSLCNIPENSPTLTEFVASLESHGFVTAITQEDVCPVISLSGSWDDYVDSLGKKYRHELRRKIRRAEGADEHIDWYIVDSTHDLNAETARFLELMAASQYEKAGFLQDPENVAFFNKIIPVSFAQGWLQISFLNVDGKSVAAYMNFDYNNQIMVYNSGLLPGEYGHLSLGIVLLAHNIRHAIEHGRSDFDFLQGNESYKYQMGGQDTRIFRLEAH